jgi:hypothetical protein
MDRLLAVAATNRAAASRVAAEVSGETVDQASRRRVEK